MDERRAVSDSTFFAEVLDINDLQLRRIQDEATSHQRLVLIYVTWTLYKVQDLWLNTVIAGLSITIFMHSKLCPEHEFTLNLTVNGELACEKVRASL